jgi:hypothetical protein
MNKDKANFSKNSEALYFDIDERKVYDPTMLGISDLRSKKEEDEPEKKSFGKPAMNKLDKPKMPDKKHLNKRPK